MIILQLSYRIKGYKAKLLLLSIELALSFQLYQKEKNKRENHKGADKY
jgi:hypothetical protein